MFMNYLPSQGDPAGWKKIKIEVHYKTICITKITMIPKYLEDATSFVTGPARIDHVSANYTELYFR